MKASPKKSEQFVHLFIHQTDHIRHNITPVSRSITNHSETSATSLVSLSDLEQIAHCQFDIIPTKVGIPDSQTPYSLHH